MLKMRLLIALRSLEVDKYRANVVWGETATIQFQAKVSDIHADLNIL